MVNTCTMVITKGINKGRLCKDMNRWCKHKKVFCDKCKRTFSYQHSYNAHACMTAKTKVRIKVNAKTKTQPAAPTPLEALDTMELKNMVHQLRGEIDEIRKQPKVQINNLTVITDDIFNRIVSQMGEQEGVKFLLDSLNNEAECLNIVDKVYLNGRDKNQYPIACKDNNHFRFMGPDYDVVDDIGGDLIVSKITSSVQNACLKASADLIHEHVEGNETESLYKQYDILTVQDRIKRLPTASQRERLKAGLAIKFTNPTHPFFQLEE